MNCYAVLLSYILLGLRYNDVEIGNAFQGVSKMRESTTYQAILREGRQEGLVTGIVTGKQESILQILRARFGSIPSELESKILQTNDVDKLKLALDESLRVVQPGELHLD